MAFRDNQISNIQTDFRKKKKHNKPFDQTRDFYTRSLHKKIFFDLEKTWKYNIMKDLKKLD